MNKVKKRGEALQLEPLLAEKGEVVDFPTNARLTGRTSARLFGTKSYECPFPSGTPECFEWLAGWMEFHYSNDRLPGAADAVVLPLRRIREG